MQNDDMIWWWRWWRLTCIGGERKREEREWWLINTKPSLPLLFNKRRFYRGGKGLCSASVRLHVDLRPFCSHSHRFFSLLIYTVRAKSIKIYSLQIRMGYSTSVQQGLYGSAYPKHMEKAQVENTCGLTWLVTWPFIYETDRVKPLNSYHMHKTTNGFCHAACWKRERTVSPKILPFATPRMLGCYWTTKCSFLMWYCIIGLKHRTMRSQV